VRANRFSRFYCRPIQEKVEENPLLHRSASNVVMTGRSVNGNRPKLTPFRSEKTLTDQNQTEHSSLRSENSLQAETYDQAIKGAPPTKGQHIRLLVVFFFFFFNLFVSCHRADFDDLYVKRRGLAQGRVIWGSQRFQTHPRCSFSPKTPKFRAGIGISSLNKIMKNCLTVHAIFAQISSINATWRRTS
jgi:hypothetical protein